MLISKEFLEESEIIKNNLLTSKLDEQYKKQFLHILNISKLSLEVSSNEDKLQKLAETIYYLVIFQFNFLNVVNEQINNANIEQCKTCAALKHAKDFEQQKQEEKLINEWKKQNNINIEDKQDISQLTWTNILKQLLIQPGIWILAVVIVISPYGADIVKTILQFFSK